MSPAPAWAGDPPRDDDEARRRIRDAARRCMDRHGVNVRITEVARELGVSRPTVYRHYPSSERLLVAVAADSIAPLLEQIRTAFGDFTGTPGDMLVEQMALLLELLPREPYLGLLLTSGSANVFAKRMTSEATMSLAREFIQRLLPVDWEAHGYDDEALDQLVEITTRIVQSFMLDPGDRPRTGEELRRFLRRWVGTAVDAVPVKSVCTYTDLAGSGEDGEDETLSQLSAFVQFASRRSHDPRQRHRMAIAARTPVTGSEVSALRTMHRYECRSVNELAVRLGLERSTVSRSVGRLTGLGLVRRETDPADRRRTWIGLTDAGRRVLVALDQVARDDLAVATASWDPADRRALGALADRLRHDLERLGPDEND